MMANRTNLKQAICVASTLAVLMAVLTSPIRPLATSQSPIVPNYLRRNFALPPTLAKRLCTPSDALEAAPIKAVRTEAEEDEPVGRASCPAWLLSDQFHAPAAPATARDPADGVHSPPSRPLRC